MPSTPDLNGFAEDFAANSASGGRSESLGGALVTSVFAETMLDGAIDEHAWHAAFDYVIEIENRALRRRLVLILDALREPEPAKLAGPMLMAYGIELCDARRFGSAVSVFRVLAREATADLDLRKQANQQAALTLRKAGRHEESACEFAAGEFIRTGGDRRERLQADLGRAGTHIARGQMREAVALTASVRRRAVAAGDDFMVAKADANAATIAGRQGRYADAMRLVIEALPHLAGHREFDQARAVLARAFLKLGNLEQANEIAAWNRVHASDPETRFDAALVLIEAACRENDAPRALMLTDGLLSSDNLPAWVATELDELLVSLRRVGFAAASDDDKSTPARLVVASGASRR